MAIKKSELYSSLWASCDALRGGMDASQYKDYVLTMLFLKYVSDKYHNKPDAEIIIPDGAGFSDTVKLKGTKEIGDGINKIIGKLAVENDMSDLFREADFNSDDKLGSGKEKIDRLTNLVTIFQKPELDFSKNRAEGDDILGDAYEYLMRHFATESGKSKGQFYTPAEVSRVIAKVLQIKSPSNATTFYDPTCGSGSLLLKVIDEADNKGTIYGQEKDVATAALAKMNMIVHNQTSVEIKKGQSTLSNPLWHNENGGLKTFDFVVANPPFSLRDWSTGFDPANDIYGRFEAGKIPPDKNGDYAFLLHIIKSLKSKGKGACILPHGVLFRGNAEAEIRKSIIKQGYIKGIIGLPTNLFYGTGIPACIIVIDKENAEKTRHLTDEQRGIFMINASKGFIKDGNKNRLREQDIHKIVDVFTKQTELPKYSRFISIAEIADPKNDYNLNIPRYIDSQEEEDIQDIAAHLLGGIPDADIEKLENYWSVYPTLKDELFSEADREGYSQLKISKETINDTIFSHAEFIKFSKEMAKLFDGWKLRTVEYLKGLDAGLKPKATIAHIAEDILQSYFNKKLIDPYDVYQHLMDYWNETMQDDCYIIAVDGWKAEPYRILVENKKKVKVDKGWACDLVPKHLVVQRYFAKEQAEIDALAAQLETVQNQLTELEEEHSGEEGYFADFEKVNKTIVEKCLKKLKKGKQTDDEKKVLENYVALATKETELKKQIKTKETELDVLALEKYPKLSTDEIKQLAVDDKWMATIEKTITAEMDNISQALTRRIKQLAERYETPLPQISQNVAELEAKVTTHLEKMGFALPLETVESK